MNSSTEENRDDLENHLNGTTRATATKLIEPAVGSDWYLYCDENFTNVSLIEEKIYEDLCYVTFSTKSEVRVNPSQSSASENIFFSSFFSLSFCVHLFCAFNLLMLVVNRFSYYHYIAICFLTQSYFVLYFHFIAFDSV